MPRPQPTSPPPEADSNASAPPVDLDLVREALQWTVNVARHGREAGPPPVAEPFGKAAWRALPRDEVREALDAVLLAPHLEAGLDAMQRLGVLAAWLPEVEAMVGMGDAEWRHKDVWKHTKQVVRQAPPRLLVRWGALLHDIGKPRTRRIDERGKVHFHGHSEVGAAMFRRKLARRMGFEGDFHDRLHGLILYHLRPNQYRPSWTDSAVRRFRREVGDLLEDLLDLSRADITTKRPERKRRGLRQIDELAARIREIDAQDARVAPLPKGLGHALMEAFGIPPSKRLGDLRKAIEADVEAGHLEPQREAEYYVAWVRNHPERFGLQ